MDTENPTSLSRRNFLKANSLFLLGQIVFNHGVTRLVSALDGGEDVPNDPDWDFSIELLRKADLLQLKYYFYNARIRKHHIENKNGGDVLIYIKVPPQHIAEELVDAKELGAINSYAGFMRKRSFLSNSSWLGFKMAAEKVKLEPDALLDWAENFDMLTIDSFYQNNDNHDDYTQTLKDIKAAFESQAVGNNPVLQAANKKLSLPLTTFDIPYKIWLSPIAEPVPDDTTSKRLTGEHIFTADNKQQELYVNKNERDRHLQIVALWENNLMFRDKKTNGLTSPRFKVVRSLCPSTDDSDAGVSLLLPMPFNRYELKGLTMRKEPDRDVVSDYFRLSALGGTAHLKYKNDDPTPNFAMVAWDQVIKYGRDNYVSITYRAVDVFTGFKMKFSVIAERAFKFGVSYLPRLYHVDYFELEKVYADPIVISNVPYTRLVPKISGAYFRPQPISDPIATGGAFLVSKPDYALDPFDPGQLLQLGYTGYDKNGNQHDLILKMILIPAEQYIITSGTYLSVYNNKKYNINDPVPITDIGDLNPAQEDGKAISADCPPSKDTYTFKLVKTFSYVSPGPSPLDPILKAVKAHIQAHSDVYSILLNRDISYVKIDGLKTSGLIDKDSSNGTFKTKSMLLSPLSNGKLAGPGLVIDLFLTDTFPLVPSLASASVIIPQIDQIQGRSEYHDVVYYKDYLALNNDLENSKDPVKLFFELVNPISNFFSDNYRSSGAVVNPGIKITHVSALNQTISFNDKTGDPSLPIQTPNIFRELKGSILGIPILEIIQDVLQLGDLPQFNFLGPIEQSVAQFAQLAQQFQGIASDWASRYQQLVDQVNSINKQIMDAENTLKLLSKANLQTWLETIVSQQQVRALYQSEVSALLDDTIPPGLATSLKTEYNSYYTTVLKPFLDKSEGIFPISADFGNVLAVPSANNIRTFLKNIHDNKPIDFNESYCKEAIKAYCVNQFVSGNAPGRVYELLNAVVNYYQTVDQLYLSYCNAINQGIQEAIDFSSEQIKQQFDKVDNQLKSILGNIPDVITSLINKVLSSDDLKGWFCKLNQLITIYDHYYRLYMVLKKDYYIQLQTSLNVTLNNLTHIDQIESRLNTRFAAELDLLKDAANAAPQDIKDAYNKLHQKLTDTLASKADALRNYASYMQSVQAEIKGAIKSYTDLFESIYAEYNKRYEQLKQLRADLQDPKGKLKDFVRTELTHLQQDVLEPAAAKMLTAAKGTSEYQQASATVSEIQGFLKKVQSLSHQSVHYTFSTGKFRPASFANVIEFVPNDKTLLSLDVNYDVQLSLTSLDKPPAIAKQSFVTISTLADFKVGLLQLLYIDFEQVNFTAGSDIKDSFTVRVRDVDFGGFLSFFDVFKDYLKSLSDNLAFDLTTAGATIGYALKIPDIQTGYFNFFNLGLSASIFLPFDPDRSIELHFGIANSQNKFGLTLMGIFGGQGYFDIIADPKKGIVGMEIALEFGAIFHLDLGGVVEGTAYLVGGIYIKLYDGQYALKAYILCAGRLSVLGLISASLSFYLGLEGDGHLLSGVCVLTVSIKLGPFFEISVQCEMRKEIAGTRSSGNSSSGQVSGDAKIGLMNGINVADSNLHYDTFYRGDYLFITVEDELNRTRSTLSGPRESFEPSSVRTEGKHKFYEYETASLKPGQYELSVSDGSNKLIRKFSLDDDNSAVCAIEEDKVGVNDFDYYASYYYYN